MSECATCGVPVWRRDGHAGWCATWKAANAASTRGARRGSLTLAEVVTIRARYRQSTQAALAADYGVSVKTIDRVVNHRGRYAEAS